MNDIITIAEFRIRLRNNLSFTGKLDLLNEIGIGSTDGKGNRILPLAEVNMSNGIAFITLKKEKIIASGKIDSAFSIFDIIALAKIFAGGGLIWMGVTKISKKKFGYKVIKGSSEKALRSSQFFRELFGGKNINFRRKLPTLYGVGKKGAPSLTTFLGRNSPIIGSSLAGWGIYDIYKNNEEKNGNNQNIIGPQEDNIELLETVQKNTIQHLLNKNPKISSVDVFMTEDGNIVYVQYEEPYPVR